MPAPSPRSSASNSRMVPRLTHRAPVRRGMRARAARVVAFCRAMPLVPVTALGLVALGFGFSHYLNETEYFSLQQISIGGIDRLSESQVRAYMDNHAGVTEGVSLVHISTEALAERLMSLPEVATARVLPIWPDQLVITLKERSAAGIYVSDTSSMVFDESGLLFAASRATDLLNSTLPILTGMHQEPPLEVGSRLPEAPLRTAMAYAATFREAAPSLATRIAELHWDDVAGLTLLLDDGAQFRCGYRSAEETGPVVEALMARTGTRRIATANLVAREHAAVRWIEPPPPPAPANVARTR